MNDSIQSTLFNNYDKDANKSIRQLEKELENINGLMSYDKRPVALANFDKRKKHLQALINNKQSKQGVVTEDRVRKASRVKETDDSNDNIMYRKSSSLKDKKMEENASSVDVTFTNLININNICE